MDNAKWFDRKFDFNFGTDRFSALYERLKMAPDTLTEILSDVPSDVLVFKPNGGWSVKEHAGHLSILEPIWQIRFIDILEAKEVLSPADLDNKATTEAGFNNWSVVALLEKFRAVRRETLELLSKADVQNEKLTSLHPRTKQPMRVIDLAYFVAEHDDHHFASMRNLIGE